MFAGFLHFTIDGIEREISTKLKADPEKWSAETNRLQGKPDSIKAFNDYLDALQAKAINARTQLTALDHTVTAAPSLN